MPKIEKLLFFCAGNTCRSPFTEFYAKLLKETKFKEEYNKILRRIEKGEASIIQKIIAINSS